MLLFWLFLGCYNAFKMAAPNTTLNSQSLDQRNVWSQYASIIRILYRETSHWHSSTCQACHTPAVPHLHDELTSRQHCQVMLTEKCIFVYRALFWDGKSNVFAFHQAAWLRNCGLVRFSAPWLWLDGTRRGRINIHWPVWNRMIWKP